MKYKLRIMFDEHSDHIYYYNTILACFIKAVFEMKDFHVCGIEITEEVKE